MTNADVSPSPLAGEGRGGGKDAALGAYPPPPTPPRKGEGSPPYFSRAEFDARLAAVRREMASRGLDLLLLSAPENIFYLTGLDHWGYFAPHLLIVPLAGEPFLVARAMERVTVERHVDNASFEAHPDSETAAERAGSVLNDCSLARGRIGVERWSAGFSAGAADTLKQACPAVHWIDATGLVDRLRMVKSPAEQRFMREAARVSDAAVKAAADTIRVGVSERDIAAECVRAMISAGGTYPGFGPFVRSTSRLGEEHTTWSDHRLAAGETVFLELSGCVARYHAPLGRLVHLGRAPTGTDRVAGVARQAFDAAFAALRPGALFRDVYLAWQSAVDAAGLAHYRRHHCGYVVGIGVPPSWTGGNRVTGLRHDSHLVVEPGMSFHVLSWLMGTGEGDFFRSDTVLLTAAGPEVLTRAPAGLQLR